VTNNTLSENTTNAIVKLHVIHG